MNLDMTKGSPLKLILKFLVPVLLGCLFQQLYNMVDTIIVGKGVGSDALAAVGATGTIVFFILGFMNGLTTGFTVLSHSETAGLGAKATEDDFKSQFIGKSANGINYTKNGASSDNEIDALSGATITSNAVCEAVDSALAVYNNQLKEVD